MALTRQPALELIPTARSSNVNRRTTSAWILQTSTHCTYGLVAIAFSDASDHTSDAWSCDHFAYDLGNAHHARSHHLHLPDRFQSRAAGDLLRILKPDAMRSFPPGCNAPTQAPLPRITSLDPGFLSRGKAVTAYIPMPPTTSLSTQSPA